LDRVYIHIPCHMFKDYSEKAIREKINIDLYPAAGFLDNAGMEEMTRIRDRFHENGLGFSLHAPFIDISPGSPDPRIADVAKYRIIKSLQFAHFLRAKVMVCHSGSEVLRYGFPYKSFVKNSIKFWDEIKYIAQDLDVKIAIENTIEKEPKLQSEIVNSIDSSHVGYCFDIGHWNLKSTLPIEGWLRAFRNKLFAAHIHDNNGDGDSHLAIGRGQIDFKPLVAFIKNEDLDTIFIVENHDEESVLDSLKVIRKGDFWV